MNKYVAILGKVHIHPLFWLVAGVAILTGYFWELLALFLIVFMHELGHAVAAQYFSWKIKRILILPFGGICEVDEHGNRPIKEELLVIASGPLQHVWMGLIIFLLGFSSYISTDYARLLFQFNLMVLFFNLLPVWPLDGGKFIQLFLAMRKPFIKAYKQSLLSSFILLIILHLCILFLSPLNLNISVVFAYLYVCLWLEWKQQPYVYMRFLLERYYGKQVGFKQLQLMEAKGDEFLYAVMERFQRGCKHLIQVDSQASEFKKLDENEVLHAYFTEKQVNARLKDIVYDD